VLLFWWLVRLPASAMTHPWVIYPALLTLAAYLGLFVALFGFAVRFIRRRIGWSPLAVAPAAWTACEWLKSSGALGCPWGNLSYALAREPAWIQGASIAGAPGLSAWIAAVNALFAGAVTARTAAGRGMCLAAAALAIAVPVGWGAARVREANGPERLTIALVQPDIRSEEKWDPARQEKSVSTLARLTLEAARHNPSPDLVVWPETALPFYVRLEGTKLARLLDLARETGVPMLVGYPDARLTGHGGVTTHNAAGLILPNGTIAGQYEKIHLVPFGERIPFQEVFPFLGKIDLGQAEWTPGAAYTLFPLRDTPFSVLICFESIFPELSRRFAREGARFLVNITNDEWFGPTAAPHQHADMAVLRCVEQGMGMARCANTGVSMFIDPFGRVSGATPLFAEAVSVGTVVAGTRPTVYSVWGDWLTLICVGLVAVLLALGWYRPAAHPERPGLH
jgi:apolipoprotein N-acyltransferase